MVERPSSVPSPQGSWPGIHIVALPKRREACFFREHSTTFASLSKQDAIEERKVQAKILLYMVSKAIR